jgi:hypothetical protein
VTLYGDQTLDAVLWMLTTSKEPSEPQFYLYNNPCFYRSLEQQTFDNELVVEPLNFSGKIKEITRTGRFLYVIVDSKFHISFEFCQPPQIFGNIWKPHKDIILRGETFSGAQFSVLICA